MTTKINQPSLVPPLFNWKNVLPELAIVIPVSFSLKTFDFPIAGLLFLLSTMLLRFVWNSATLIHGLGHAVSIAAVDRHLSAFSPINLLEHRSVGAVLRSLLPFSSIFLPGDPQSRLWIAAGEGTEWRIRIKAIGGIYLNLLAIIILLQFPLTSSDYFLTCDSRIVTFFGAFLHQSFLGANLLVILSSWSDIAAFVTGVAEVFYCGNFGFLGERNANDDPRQLLPQRVINVFQTMGHETEIRGEQAGGGLVVASNLDHQTVFVGKKVVNRKRDNLTQSLEAAFARERYRAALAGIKPCQSTVMGVWHYRFGTSGPPSILETHWHEWSKARQARVWQFLDGEWTCQLKNVNHRITHNGDFDAWTLHHQSIDNVQLGWWLERVLHTSNQTKGDSPKIAGMMDLLVTQGMWDASVRLAYQLAIATSISTSFGGQKPAPDAPNTAPSEQDIDRWAAIFETVFVSYHKLLAAPDSFARSRCFRLLEQRILQATTHEHSMSLWTWQRRNTFVRTAIHAFFHNDLYSATQLFMSGAQGSFGLVTVSTLEQKRLVLSAQGQSMSVGFNWQEGYMVYASEPAAIDAVLLNLPHAYRLDLDQQQGEIALVSSKDIALYSMRQNCEVAPSALQDRWISMTKHPYLPHVKYPKNNHQDPVMVDCQEIPKILEEIRLSWQNPVSLDRKSADYFVQLFCKKARHFEQKRQTMMRVGLTGHAQQSSSIDLLVVGVENSLWLGERFAQDLKIVFPLLNVQALSSNQVLEQLQHNFSSLQLGQDSIVLAITQSGQTFPTVQVIHTFDQLYRQNIIGELFILTGQVSSFLGSPVIQPKHSNTLRYNVFVNGSGRRTSEPATATVAAAQQTLTELLLYLAKQVKHQFPHADPFGMTLTEDSCAALEKMKDDFLEINVVQVMGTTLTGKNIETPIRQTLVANGRKWALHVLETPLAWGIHALYVAVTVGWSIPFGYNIPLASTTLGLFAWAFQISQDALLLKLAKPVVTLMDIAIYIFGVWLWTLALRYCQGRQLLARTGKRTLVIGDVPWVSQLLKSYVSKLFALSYGIASLEVHGANPADGLLHDFGHRVVRGTLLFLGIPDGRRGHKQKQQENAAIMTGKQASGVRNINVGPEVVVVGADPEIRCKGFTNAIVLEGHDDFFYFNDSFGVAPCANRNAENQAAIIEELRESRFGAFERLLAGYVFFWALARKVASFPVLRYQYWKSQSRTKIMTTAAPVPGMTVAAIPNNLDPLDQDDTSESIVLDIEKHHP